MEFEFYYRNNGYKIVLKEKDNKLWTLLGDEWIEIDVQFLSSSCISLLMKNRSYKINFLNNENTTQLLIEGELFELVQATGCEGYDSVVESGKGAEARYIIKAPMPGNILKVQVKEGDSVEEGQCLAIVEAMKMETGLNAVINGRVKRVNVRQGDQVNAGEVLIELEDIEH